MAKDPMHFLASLLDPTTLRILYPRLRPHLRLRELLILCLQGFNLCTALLTELLQRPRRLLLSHFCLAKLDLQLPVLYRDVPIPIMDLPMQCGVGGLLAIGLGTEYALDGVLQAKFRLQLIKFLALIGHVVKVLLL
jgi:hypothetical protein